MRWRPSGRPGPESVHRTTLATLAEQNRRQVGPTILFDHHRQEPPPLTSLVSPCGPANLWASAEHVRWVRGELFKFRPLDFGPSIKMTRYPW